jgi:hypothetical protein
MTSCPETQLPTPIIRASVSADVVDGSFIDDILLLIMSVDHHCRGNVEIPDDATPTPAIAPSRVTTADSKE